MACPASRPESSGTLTATSREVGAVGVLGTTIGGGGVPDGGYGWSGPAGSVGVGGNRGAPAGPAPGRRRGGGNGCPGAGAGANDGGPAGVGVDGAGAATGA